jgi:hypothetical protein
MNDWGTPPVDRLAGHPFGVPKSTGTAFVAYATASHAPGGAVPVCRFFSSQFTSHYTVDAGECDAVTQKWPNVWTLETRTAFYVYLPDKNTGKCASGMQPSTGCTTTCRLRITDTLATKRGATE